jgi:DNA polymerase
MSKSNAWGLPGALGKAAQVLNASEQKDPAGNNLIAKLSVPRSPTQKDDRMRFTPADAPEDFSKLYDYCDQDIRAERSVSELCPDLSAEELELWMLDQRINTRGVYIDPKGLADCVDVIRQAKDRYTQELINITGIPDITVNKIQQLRGWMAGRGFATPSLDADHVEAALKRTDLPPDVYRVLQLRATLGSASVKKTAAIDRTVSLDSRLRDLFTMNGARQTGRWAGRGAQPQNLPNSGPPVSRCTVCGNIQWQKLGDTCIKCLHPVVDTEWGAEAVEAALEAIATRDLDYIESLWGDATATVAGCLRGLFSAPDGYELICSDYSAIEAVVLAMLAGEQWRIDVFRTHGLIYEMSAAKITGIPFDEFIKHKETTGSHHPLRKKIGKLAELASGYQGGLGAWKQFGAGEFMTDDEIQTNVKAWRAASPAIVNFWEGLENAAKYAIQNPGSWQQYRGIYYIVEADVLYCRLLSGRTLAYHRPRLIPDTLPWGKKVLKITFMGWNSDSSKGPVGWMERDTYGGKLCENVVQATANDVLRHAMPLVERAGYPIVLHVHDEIVSEVPKGSGSIEEYESLMATLPAWCADWPIKASGGWRGKRYRKD